MSAPRISFEFFPPKSLDASFRLWETVQALRHLNPSFVSVTYGAGGTTRKLTHEAVETIHRHYGLNVAAHLTCVDASRDETLEIARAYAAAGVSEIVALRGDPPRGAGRFTPHPDGFRDSAELVAALAETGLFKLRVGAYPDRHPEAADDSADIRWLKHKIDAGAHSAITQFFFEPETFLRFRDRAAAAGIAAPILPGILSIENWKGVRKFAEGCGTLVPDAIAAAFEAAQADGTTEALAHRLCVEMCRRLLDEGVEDLHFYTLNKPHLTEAVCRDLGIVPGAGMVRVA